MAVDPSTVFEDYKRLITELIEKVKTAGGNLQQNTNDLKDSAIANLPNQESFNNLISAVRTSAEDLTPPGDNADLYKSLVQNYCWVGTCLFASSLFSQTLGRILGPLIGLFIGGGALYAFCFIVAPYLIVDYIPKSEGTDDRKRLSQLALGVLSTVIFVNTILADSSMPFYAPPTFVTPLLIAVLSDAVGVSVGLQARFTFLGVILGVPAAFNLVYGLAMGSICVFYIIWNITLSSVAFVDVQMKISLFKGGRAVDPVLVGISQVAFMISMFVMSFLCSSSGEQSE